MMKCVGLAIVAVAFSSLAAANELRALVMGPWCDPENGFDYKGHDLKNVPNSKMEDCCSLCTKESKCVAWTYSTYNGGTCWLKDAVDEIVPNADVKSGRIFSSYPGDSNAGYYYTDVDFQGPDIKQVPGKTVSDCYEPCRSVATCRAYSWSNFNGGTCWLKSKRGVPIVNKGVVSAEAYAGTNPYGMLWVFPYAMGTHLEGKVLQSVDEKDPAKCSARCVPKGGCNAVEWKDNKCIMFTEVTSKTQVSGAYGAPSVVWSSTQKRSVQKKVKLVLRFHEDH